MDQTQSFASLQSRVATGMNDAKISIGNLDFFYGEHKALKNINLL